MVGHGAGIFDKFFEAGHDSGASKEFAENFDFAAKLFAGDRLDELFCGDARAGVEFCDLRGGGPGQLECFTFGRKLRHETHRLRASGIDAAARQQDYHEAGRWFLTAAEAGNTRAAINYVGSLRSGMGNLRTDPELSARWSKFLTVHPEYSPVPGR